MNETQTEWIEILMPHKFYNGQNVCGNIKISTKDAKRDVKYVHVSLLGYLKIQWKEIQDENTVRYENFRELVR